MTHALRPTDTLREVDAVCDADDATVGFAELGLFLERDLAAALARS